MEKEKRESIIIIINSTAYCLLSYLAVFMLYQLTTIVTSNLYDIPNTLFYNRIGYNVRPEAWTFDSVKVIFSAGNMILLLSSVSFLVIILKAMEYNGLLRLFFIWAFIHSVSMLFGSLVLGSFTFEGFGIVLSYLYLEDTAKMILLFIGLILIMGIGMAMSKPFLFSANIYYKNLRPSDSPAFRRDQFVLPYFISTLLLLALKYPISLYETAILFFPALLLMPLFWGIRRNPVFYFEDSEKSIKISFTLVILTLLIIFVYRVLLQKGINISF